MSDMKLVGDRIREIRQDQRYNRQEMANRCGVSLSTLLRFEKGESSANAEFLENLSNLFQVNLNWLITGSGGKYQKEDAILPGESWVRIPLVTEVGAGPFKITDDIVMEEIEVPRQLIRGWNEGNVCAMLVNGDSMAPRIERGDTVITTNETQLSPRFDTGKIAVVTGNEGSTLKRVIFREDSVELLSENPDYDPFQLSYSEMEEEQMRLYPLLALFRSFK